MKTLKGKGYRIEANGKWKRCKDGCLYFDKDIRAALEWFMEMRELINEALDDGFITVPEYNWWADDNLLKEAFEDVMKLPSENPG